jgi:hypothetical protein
VTHEPRCTGTKVCKTCGLCLNVLAFAVQPECVDGLQSSCRECEARYQRTYQHRRRAEKKGSKVHREDWPGA